MRITHIHWNAPLPGLGEVNPSEFADRLTKLARQEYPDAEIRITYQDHIGAMVLRLDVYNEPCKISEIWDKVDADFWKFHVESHDACLE